jgi:hypothetical protein
VAGVAHGFLALAALVALLGVPCLLALVIFADVAIERAEQSLRRAAQRWRSRWEATRLEHSTGIQPAPGRLLRRLLRRLPGVLPRLPGALRHRSAGHRPDPEASETPAGPPFEQVAADLRRLARQRAEVAPRSPVWFAAVHRAYDDRLRIACRELEIAEHLHDLEGIDLEIERLRVEGLLEAAGLSLAVADTDGRQDTR